MFGQHQSTQADGEANCYCIVRCLKAMLPDPKVPALYSPKLAEANEFRGQRRSRALAPASCPHHFEQRDFGVFILIFCGRRRGSLLQAVYIPT